MSSPFRSIAVALCLAALFCAHSVAAGPAGLTWEPRTGEYALEAGVPDGTLLVTGTLGEPVTRATARLVGRPGSMACEARRVSGTTAGLEVVVQYEGIGSMTYRLDPSLDGGGELLATNIDADRCAELDEYPVLVAAKAAYLGLQHNREWEALPRAETWTNAINQLALFFAGTSYSEDCRLAIRTDDRQGCDGLSDSVTCGSHGGCCDEHDDCYARNGCNMLSWACLDMNPLSLGSKLLCKAGGGKVCGECNQAVLDCFAGPEVGPSVCCAAGTCGERRDSLSIQGK